KKDFKKSLVVMQVLRVVNKKVSKNKTSDWPQDSLLVKALRHYINASSLWAKESIYKKDLVLIVLEL
ncbi:20791_t:CDS:1, partial [Cetraspora pellucida]